MSSKNEIATLVQARYPLIYVVSSEESRVLKDMESVSKERNVALVTWSITKGFQTISAGPGAPSKADMFKPSEALAYLEKQSLDMMVVLTDFHPYLNDPVCVRALRDTVEAYRTGKVRRTLIILSPVQVIPTDIEKSVAIIDWALPNREELKQIASGIAAQLKTKPDMEAVADAALGLTEVEAENAMAKAAVKTGMLDPKTIQDEKKQIIRKSGLLEYVETEESEATVGGLGNVKAFLKKRRNAFSEKARAFKLAPPKGIVAVGISGTGKSLLAKACGSMFGMPLLRLDLGKVFQGLVGSSEENMRKVLKTVEAVAPCVLWCDEVEKSFSGVDSSGATDGGTTSRVFGTFLTWMQEKKASVFVVMTANAVERLPPELTRKGRIDETFFVDLPSCPEREEIFRIHLNKVGRGELRLDISSLADATNGYTGAEIAEIVNSALYDAFDAGTDLTNEILIAVARRIVPISRSSEERVEALRKWAKDKAIPASAPEAEVRVSGRRISN